MTREILNLADPDAMDGSQSAMSGDVIDSAPAPVAETCNSAYPSRPGPAGNAVCHGLTARTVLPDALHLLLDADGTIDVDASFTAAISNQPLERLGRYRRLHERAFHEALGRLRELQARQQESTVHAQFARFRSEEACEDYLFQRARQSAGSCPRCGSRHGYWLARRRRECGTCGLQVGVRFGTAMESSRLPLRIWFLAIGEVLANPTIRAERLQLAIDVPRLGTVRKLLKKILTALRSPDVDRLLAGLERFAPQAGPPDVGDPWRAI
jgi:hypothetical protein